MSQFEEEKMSAQNETNCSTCLCTNRTIPFSYTFNVLNDIIKVGNPQLIGMWADVDCKVETCFQEVEVKVCDTVLTCCIPLDALHINGTGSFLFSIPVTSIMCEGENTIDYTGVAVFDIAQVCFSCLNEADCKPQPCEYIELECAEAKQTGVRQVTVAGTATFVCS